MTSIFYLCWWKQVWSMQGARGFDPSRQLKKHVWIRPSLQKFWPPETAKWIFDFLHFHFFYPVTFWSLTSFRIFYIEHTPESLLTISPHNEIHYADCGFKLARLYCFPKFGDDVNTHALYFFLLHFKYYVSKYINMVIISELRVK